MVPMLLAELVATSAAVAATRSRLAKVAALAETLTRAEPDEIEIVTSYLSGSLRQRRTGVGWRSARATVPPAGAPTLTVTQVDAAFAELADLSGPGSQLTRKARLDELMGRATADEQRWLAGLITGETRQGALDGVMVDALIRASGLPAADVRRAVMLAGVALLAGHVLLTLTGMHFASFAGALVLLGVGWNFLYIGGTTLLTTTYTAAEKGHAQATNDMTIFVVGLACSFGAGALLQALGWQMLNVVLLPWLLLAALALLWLGWRQGRLRPAAA